MEVLSDAKLVTELKYAGMDSDGSAFCSAWAISVR